MNHPRADHTAPQSRRLLIEAPAVVDADRVASAPGALLVETGGADPIVLDAGHPESVRRHPRADGALRVSARGRVLVPALVNAHTHLDLTHIGPRPYDASGGFAGWADMIRAERLHDDDAIVASVRDGIERSIRGGVALVGDIAGEGRLAPARALARSGLRGVSHIELFGVGARTTYATRVMDEACAQMDDIATERVRLGFSPHAPYSAGLGVYREAQERSPAGVPVATHLAESPEERAFVAEATGALRTLLEHLGVWDEAFLEEVGRGECPVEHIAPALRARPMLLAHLNDMTDEDIATVRASGSFGAYCPRCWSYFGRAEQFGEHRYRDMLDRGVTIAMGTDSIVNLPEDEAHRISPLDEMRALALRDGAEARTLLAMATTHGAAALGFDPSLARFDAGPVAGIIGLALPGSERGHWRDLLDAAVRHAGDIVWLSAEPAPS